MTRSATSAAAFLVATATLLSLGAAAGGSATPAELECGAVVTRSVELTRDLSDCLADGLVVGAADITLDLGGHALSSKGAGSGIRNPGFDSVTIRNGTVRGFGRGVLLEPGADGAVVELLVLELNTAAVEAREAEGSRIRLNAVGASGAGIVVAGGAANAVSWNTVGSIGGTAIVVEDSAGNRIEANQVSGTGDGALLLSGADGNTVVGNSFSGAGDGTITLHDSDGNTVTDNAAADTSDAGLTLEAGSDGNRVQRNVVGGTTNDDGFRVVESHGNELVGNTAHGVGDSGIFLQRADDNVVEGNDVRFNVGGLELDDSHGNRLEANEADWSNGIAIELSGSSGNRLVGNGASHSGGHGIEVTGGTEPAGGNVLERTTASANNGSGIVVGAGGHVLHANVADGNGAWGIHAAASTIDLGGNRAVGNAAPEQCFGVVCTSHAAPPAGCADAAIVSAAADAWIDESSPHANGGSDATLKTRSAPNGNFRTLVRFELPAVPAGCRLGSATLRLYAGSAGEGRTLEARRAASAWPEGAVTWATQPATAGVAAATESGAGYRDWPVTDLVESMYAGANHGFLVRDAVENGPGAEQQFHSREQLGAAPPRLVVGWEGPPGGDGGGTDVLPAPGALVAVGHPAPVRVVLAWSPSAGAAFYEVLRGGTVIARVSGASYTDTAVEPAASYEYGVRAVDAAGNRSTLSVAAGTTPPGDPPTPPGEVPAPAGPLPAPPGGPPVPPGDPPAPQGDRPAPQGAPSAVPGSPAAAETPTPPAVELPRPAAVQCVVPRVKGRRLVAARAAITRSNCRLGRVVRVRSAVARKGQVLAQRPTAGRRLARGTRVHLVVGRGRR